MSVSFSFLNKDILVTGASRGIGLAIARAFAHAGGNVTLLADDPEVNESAMALTGETGCTVNALCCDISDIDAVKAAISTLASLDIVVNNAGLERATPIEDPSSEVDELFRRIIDINVLGTYNVTRAALPRIHDNGRIIITSSIWGKTAVAQFSAYCASKHANIGFMRSMAHELAHRGITVNAVCPGWVRTDASMRTLELMAEQQQRTEQQILHDISEGQALPGLMTPGDITDTYLFLASTAAANITGQALNVDRGEVMA